MATIGTGVVPAEEAAPVVAAPGPGAAAPCAVVIFGATGDLTKRKLVPALYALAHDGLLPAGFAMMGTGRTRLSDAQFRELMRAGGGQLRPDPPRRTSSGTASPTPSTTPRWRRPTGAWAP